MNKGHISACILAASVIVASSASADTYSDCEAAVADGNTGDIIRFASRISRYSDIPEQKQASAAACVSAHLGEPLAYDPDTNEFIPQAQLEAIEEQKAADEVEDKEAVRQRVCELQEVVTETRETIRQAEAAQQDRRIETLAVTIQECSAWFEDDAREALTNDVCNSIFASGGLPNSDIAGPTTSEVLLAEVINTNANTELEILVESGMLLETIAAMATEMGIAEDGDAYDCDQ